MPVGSPLEPAGRTSLLVFYLNDTPLLDMADLLVALHHHQHHHNINFINSRPSYCNKRMRRLRREISTGQSGQVQGEYSGGIEVRQHQPLSRHGFEPSVT